MGVQGFTTYMSEHFELFHEFFKLKNSNIVIDGNGVAVRLYLYHTKSYDRFGGDYDKYANTVHKFFNLLKKCNVTPIILFDGAYEDGKYKILLHRLKQRINTIKKLNSSTRKCIRVFPMFTRGIFLDIALSLGLKCIRTDYECDSEIACLGRYLHCPILGYDSDFYFFDALYLPFDKFEMKTVRYYDEQSKTHENYIPCQVYNIEYFFRHFGGLNKTNLPLLPVLLGNDYVEKNLFSEFCRNVILKKSKTENKRQVFIQSVINWLQCETLESALYKISQYFEAQNRESISLQVENAMKGYQQVNSTITDCLKDIYTSQNPVDAELYFVVKYRQCKLPACFANIKWKNKYLYCPQVENYADPNSHEICLDILSSLHKILTSSAKSPFYWVSRSQDTAIKEERVEEYSGELPGIEDVPNLSKDDCKHLFLKILKIDGSFQEFLNMFPPNWHVYLISLYYWKKNSKKVIDMPYIYSLLICAILLNFVDPKIGFCRSQYVFDKMYKMKKLENPKPKSLVRSESIQELFEKIEYIERVLCLKAFLDFFNFQPKKCIDQSLNEATIVGYFSEFQSCALHIKSLNNLLCCPFDDLTFSKFFSGTFLYNTVVDFRSKSNLKSYLELLFENSENILYGLNLMMMYIEQYFVMPK